MGTVTYKQQLFSIVEGSGTLSARLPLELQEDLK